MHPDRFEYSPLWERPRLTWPNGARIALWVVPNVEFFASLPPADQVRDPWPRMPHPDILGYGQRDYGPRSGFWRILDLFDAYKIRPTVSLNLAVYEHFPDIREACESRQWDVLCHGYYNTTYNTGLSEDEERTVIKESQAFFDRLTGRSFSGWFSAGGASTLVTPDLLAEAGLKYWVDYFHDDQPFPMKVRSGQLLTLPYSMDVNDGRNFRENATEGREFADTVIDQFDRLYAESADTGLVMNLPIHPYIMGMPHRISHLERIFDHIFSHEGIWQATGSEIADWYKKEHLPEINRYLMERAL